MSFFLDSRASASTSYYKIDEKQRLSDTVGHIHESFSGGRAHLMYAHTALVMVPRVALPLMPVIFESAAEHDTGLKRPVPFFFCAAAFFLPAAWVARVGESSEPCVRAETS